MEQIGNDGSVDRLGARERVHKHMILEELFPNIEGEFPNIVDPNYDVTNWHQLQRNEPKYRIRGYGDLENHKGGRMRREKFQEHVKESFDQCLGILTEKNWDYADPTDAFSNVRQCELFGIATVEAGVLTRIIDKISRVSNLLRAGHRMAVHQESVTDNLLDIACYAVMLSVYIRDKQRGPDKKREPDVES
jgi:hypothetical protein